jgi:hypothetical protein
MITTDNTKTKDSQKREVASDRFNQKLVKRSFEELTHEVVEVGDILTY